MAKRSLTVICAALLLALGVAAASAQPFDKRTTFRFTGPVAVPGVTLPAGGYVFRVADSAGRDVIQVLSADGKTPYAMFFALRATRAEAAKNPEVRFLETAEGMPRAVESWWYPAERSGYEFVYPREQARLLAKGTGKPVLSGNAPAPSVAPELTWVYPTGEEQPAVADHEPVLEPKTAVIAGNLAEPFTPEPAAPARQALPKTASPLPLVLALGFALLGGAAATRWLHVHGL
jgi:hypothetical protein